jgi:hypothetical protein
MNDLELRGPPTKPVPERWHFRFNHFGWAIFTICNETGCFDIQSDWGDYSHRWNPAHLGEGMTLKRFIAADGRADYLTNKLSYNKPREFTEEWDADETRLRVKGRIIEARKSGAIDRARAAELWFDLKHYACFDSVDAFLWGLQGCHHLGDWLEEPFECCVFKTSSAHDFLLEKLLPFFQAHLRAEMEGPKEVADARDGGEG